MSVFYGEMAEPSDPTRLPAIVTIDEGSIRLATDQTELGEWKLTEVQVGDRGEGSVLLEVEGDELILFLQDQPRFLAETAPFRWRKDRRPPAKAAARASAKAAPKPPPRRAERPVAETGAVAYREVVEPATPRRPAEPKPPGRPAVAARAAGRRGLGALRRRWAIWVPVVLFAAGVAFAPGLVTAVFLLAGTLVLALGGLALADVSLAVRIPAPLTPLRLVAIGAALAAIGIGVDLVR
jgi:hypothetical protein